MMPKNHKFFLFLILLIAGTLLLSGCVRRRMTVRSNPPGATVYLDGKEIGRTPFSTNFDFYGKREFRLVKEGYETKTVLLPVRAPWYQWIGFDFISEVVLPGKLTDHKYYEFEMLPDRIVPNRELVDRAEDLRRMAHAEGTLNVADGRFVSSQNNPQSGSLVSNPDIPGATVYQPSVTNPVQQQQSFSSPSQPSVYNNNPVNPNTYSPPQF